jgi:DNA polymerase-1
MKKLVLIDSNAVIHRAYHALPKTMSTRKGEQTNAIYGFVTTLIKTLEDLKPDYVAAAFDVSKATFRTEQYAEYKATRIKADQELYDQIPRIKEVLTAFDIPIYEKEGYEADDIIGTITSKIRNPKSEIRNKSQIKNSNVKNDSTIQRFNDLTIYIVSGDKDIYQLIDGNIFVYSLRKGLSQMSVVDHKTIQDEYNLDPEDFIDLKALAGDASDNIPGVPGIGPKTATTLIQKFDTLKNLYLELEKKGSDDFTKEYNIKERIVNLLTEHKEQAFLSQSLATIYKEVPMEFDLQDAKWGEYDRAKARNLFEELGFHSLLKRFGVEEKDEVKTEQTKKQAEKDKQLKLL